ncbi:urea amidolyase associated protein UAAP1 [Bryobacter aggregatus]|uniref:urea amidolyase associated protein UAAP1 n=1 Tax=Bryobacter aggregatus TaxID=360054 RepID=UPI0004E0E1DB|nr:urea amidolyase associated protein UAAP1 [Bryobacter aggregatus]
MASACLLFEEELRGGASFAHVLKRGTSLRITDLHGGANVPITLFNFELLVERYNMADTLKQQHTAHLTQGHCLYSDMGRVLCSITNDTVGWHDPIGAYSTRASVAKKYGAHDYQEFRNDWYTSTRENFLREIGKFGLSIRDLQSHINFFSKLQVDLTGSMHFVPGNSKAGDSVELRSEMNTLVIIDTNPHPLDPNPNYEPKPVHLSFQRVDAPAADDQCRNLCPENIRGFINSERYFL